jgi:hypothetical protein
MKKRQKSHNRLEITYLRRQIQTGRAKPCTGPEGLPASQDLNLEIDFAVKQLTKK